MNLHPWTHDVMQRLTTGDASRGISVAVVSPGQTVSALVDGPLDAALQRITKALDGLWPPAVVTSGGGAGDVTIRRRVAR